MSLLRSRAPSKFCESRLCINEQKRRLEWLLQRHIFVSFKFGFHSAQQLSALCGIRFSIFLEFRYLWYSFVFGVSQLGFERSRMLKDPKRDLAGQIADEPLCVILFYFICQQDFML